MVEGTWLAGLHNTPRPPQSRYAAVIRPQDIGTRRLAGMLDALRGNDLVVMQKVRDTLSAARDGCIGVFRFAELGIDDRRGF